MRLFKDQTFATEVPSSYEYQHAGGDEHNQIASEAYQYDTNQQPIEAANEYGYELAPTTGIFCSTTMKFFLSIMSETS